MIAHLVAIGMTEHIAAGYTAVLREQGHATPADFDALSLSELKSSLNMKNGHMKKVVAHRAVAIEPKPEQTTPVEGMAFLRPVRPRHLRLLLISYQDSARSADLLETRDNAFTGCEVFFLFFSRNVLKV